MSDTTTIRVSPRTFGLALATGGIGKIMITGEGLFGQTVRQNAEVAGFVLLVVLALTLLAGLFLGLYRGSMFLLNRVEISMTDPEDRVMEEAE